jgi:predicted peroxiredoxin
MEHLCKDSIRHCLGTGVKLFKSDMSSFFKVISEDDVYNALQIFS